MWLRLCPNQVLTEAPNPAGCQTQPGEFIKVQKGMKMMITDKNSNFHFLQGYHKAPQQQAYQQQPVQDHRQPQQYQQQAAQQHVQKQVR